MNTVVEEAYLTDEERAKGFVRPVRSAYVHTCGHITTIGPSIAEAHARDPKLYSSTFCMNCASHRPVSEFRWMDGQTLGT